MAREWHPSKGNYGIEGESCKSSPQRREDAEKFINIFSQRLGGSVVCFVETESSIKTDYFEGSCLADLNQFINRETYVLGYLSEQ